MNILKTCLLVTFTTLAISTPTLAAPLLPGSFVPLSGDTVATAPETAGVVRNDNLIDFSFDITPFSSVGGRIQNRVVESDLLDTLIFAPRIRDTYNFATDNFGILGFQVDGYSGWNTDVGYRTDGSGDKGPTYASRSDDGDVLTFRYQDPLFISGLFGGAQEESMFPFITTNATNYEFTGSMTLFGYDTTSDGELMSLRLTGLAVPTSVPEPSGVLLFGFSLLGLLGLARQRAQVPDIG